MGEATQAGKLSIVATPIGNLGDMTFRAVETLKAVDYILAEDTRHSIKLLNHYEIKKSLVAYHAHNEHQFTEKIIHDIKTQQKHLALISDAGTPSISDPGYLLVNRCIDEGIDIEVLPGACALIVAVVMSGFPTHPFSFIGFLPQQKGRTKALAQLPDHQTLVLYESPHRIVKLLAEIKARFGDQRKVAVGRELTKMNETLYRGSVAEVYEQMQASTPKGEFVVVIGGENVS